MKHPNFDKTYGPDTVTVWQIIGPPIKIVIAFILGFILLANWPDVQTWMDNTFDKSDQMRTGIWMLGIGSLAFTVMFFYGVIKRKEKI